MFSIVLVACGAPAKVAAPTPTPVTPPSPPSASVLSINHIILFMQENRSFDHYFGKMNEYRAAHNIPGTVDEFPPTFSNLSYSGTQTFTAYHMVSMCTVNISSSWDESHVDINRTTQTYPSPGGTAPMDGFSYTAGKFATDNGTFDGEGERALGYYTDQDLPYYYFMASTFAMSDRWFSSVPARTQPNRMYWMAATSQGHAYPLTSTDPQLTAKTIFQALDEKGISWKIYSLNGTSTYFSMFDYYNTHSANVRPISEYYSDVANGTLPSVAYIETGVEDSGNGGNVSVDEHPDDDIQQGALFTSGLINALMASPSWKDSAFFFTFDEGGGLFDHVPPVLVPNPDGIPPQDLPSTDIQGDFNITGFRVPNFIVSPWVKKNYISHTPIDNTAPLRFIENRFGITPLTQRDSSMPDMTEFFDFSTGVAAYATPPTPPAQPTSGPCYYNALP